MSDTLLITSSIRPGTDVPVLAIRDSRERLFQTICGLLCWLREPGIRTVVLCDNTQPAYDFAPLIAHAQRLGKTLEVLNFRGDPAISAQGKARGEGEIMAYALSHSRFLQDGTVFYKASGRTFIANFADLHQSHLESPRVFQHPAYKLNVQGYVRHPDLVTIIRKCVYTFIYRPIRRVYHKGLRGLWDGKHTIATVFYKCDVVFFKENLMGCYAQTSEEHLVYLERTFYEALRGREYALFAERLDIMGRSGTYGSLYGSRYFPDDIQESAKTFLR